MIRNAGLAAILCALVWLCGCTGPVEGLTGQYEGDGHGSGPAPRLSLRSDGGGGLAAGGEDWPLRWEVRDNLVLLHSLGGGVVSLARTPEGLEGHVPGTGRVVFRKK